MVWRLFLSVFLVIIHFSEGYFEAVATSVSGGNGDVPVIQSEPYSALVAFQCGYRNRYFTKEGGGTWVTDNDPRAGCLKGKLDILKYCRKVYPSLRITNIVESSHQYEISNWCKLEGQPCKWTFNVKPYRCVVGKFESEALLVPEHCHFGHVDDQRTCKDFDYWNQTAKKECESWDAQSGTVKSFAMLEPCGLDMFSGVEFVCCPKEVAASSIDTKANSSESAEPSIDLKVKVKLGDEQKKPTPAIDDDDEDDSSDEEDDDEDSEEETIERVNAAQSVKKRVLTTTTTEKTTTEVKTESSTSDGKKSDEDDNDDGGLQEDPYFRVADPDKEYSAYRLALERVEKRHREKVTDALQKLSDAEMKYQHNKEQKPGRVEEMKEEFQRTMSTLEKSHHDERHRVDEMHEARVSVSLNERKRQAMQEYRETLSPPDGHQPQVKKVLRALQTYIKTEEKDRVHELNRYRYLLRTDMEEAVNIRDGILKKFRDIDLRVNGSIAMMDDTPGLATKVRPAALEFWQQFRDRNTPGNVDGSLTWIGNSMNSESLLEFYKKQREHGFHKEVDTHDHDKAPIQTTTKGKAPSTEQESDIRAPIEMWNTKKGGYMEHMEEVKHSHSFALKETIQHQAMMREETTVEGNNGHYGTVVLGVVGVAMLVALVVGVMTLRRRCSAHAQGFMAVDPLTPEERHISGMQVNGYENPTYTYFEGDTKAA